MPKMITQPRRIYIASAAAFFVIAIAIGLVFLALQIILRLELMQPERQYFCAEGGPSYCIPDMTLALTLGRAPVAFILIFSLLPALLAGVLSLLKNALAPRIQRWVSAGMWFAFALYLAVPAIYIYFSQHLSTQETNAGWVLYQPRSISSVIDTDVILFVTQINKAVLVILLVLALLCFALDWLGRPQTIASKMIRLSAATLLAFCMWGTVSFLTGFIRLVSTDQNFGFTFFEPDSQSTGANQEYILHLLGRPEMLGATAALCLFTFWLILKRPVLPAITKIPLLILAVGSCVVLPLLVLNHIYLVGV